jgi:hypothetical protein
VILAQPSRLKKLRVLGSWGGRSVHPCTSFSSFVSRSKDPIGFSNFVCSVRTYFSVIFARPFIHPLAEMCLPAAGAHRVTVTAKGNLPRNSSAQQPQTNQGENPSLIYNVACTATVNVYILNIHEIHLVLVLYRLSTSLRLDLQKEHWCRLGRQSKPSDHLCKQ